jgi:hypothetical protein
MNLVAFLSELRRDNLARRERHRNLALDAALYLGNRLLQPADGMLARRYAGRAYPVLFIVGAPRSGTTLLYQLAVRCLALAYVDNAAARFWMAPVVGLVHPFRRRPGQDRASVALGSTLGSTEGAHGPHEFSYFWRHWMGLHPVDELTEAALARVDLAGVDRKLAAVAGVYAAPLVVKSISFVDYHVAWLAAREGRYRFVWIDREPLYVVQSILESRRLRYGDERAWWSIRPADVDDWRVAPPIEQVCHQVAHVRRALRTAFSTLPESRRLVLQYRDLVARPGEALGRVAALAGVDPPAAADVARLQLRSGDRWRRSREERERAARLLEDAP